MAMTQKQRDERRHDKAVRLQEEDLRLKVRPGTKQALRQLMRWGRIKEQGEALTWMIHHVQGLGAAGVLNLFGDALHKIECSGNVVPIIKAAELRLTARPGTLQALDALQGWIGTQSHGATVSLMVDRLHELGRERALPMLSMPPRQKYTIPAHIAARLQRAYNRQSLRICQDD